MCDYERLPLDKCCECGKEFFIPVRADWAYKRLRKLSDATDEVRYFCSWHCLREYDKKREERRRKRRGRK